MKLVKELLLVAVACTITGSAVVFADGDPAFNSFVASLIDGFRQLVAENPNGTQFDLLVLLTQEQIQQWDATYQPPISFPGHNTTNCSLIPADQTQFGNYIAACPAFQCQPVSTCEARLLEHLDGLYNAFTESGDTVAAIVLYTHFLPCERCTQAIRDSLKAQPYCDIRKIVVFESSKGASFVNLANAQSVFDESNIGLHRFCRSSSSSKFERDETEECAVTQSFQSFIIDCLADSTAASFTSANGTVSDLVNRVMDQCKDQLSSLEVCSHAALVDLIGPAQGLTERITLANEYTQCVKQANKHTLDLRFVAKPNSLDTPISSLSDLQEYTPKSYSCEEKGLTGIFCSYAKSRYSTAGNSLCRVDSPCGNHGYSYSWCYTDYSNNWEYCCVGPCYHHGGTIGYKWCNVGSTWEYCGSYFSGDHDEVRDVKQRPCLPNYPCGKHGASSRRYWCYVDANKNWDYCCSPESACDYHGGTYKWCYTADNGYHWDYCMRA